MRHFEARDPNYADKVRASFARQQVMAYIGAQLTEVAPGYCAIRLPYRPEITQQHGYFHGGIIGTVADSAGGYAGYSLMPADASVLTVEYKLNILAPGEGDVLIAQGQVLKPGRSLVITRAEVYAERNGKRVHCASMQQTLMAMHGRSDG